MILVDTSAWIDLIAGRVADDLSELDLEQFVTCGPVVQEMLQGVRSDKVRLLLDRLDGVQRLSDPLPERLFMEAAEIYRRGRQQGLTVRSSFDCLIAAIAIENDVPVWHHDRDYETISQFTGLRAFQHLPSAGAGS
jgi:predicted nucleic acid-binding protein